MEQGGVKMNKEFATFGYDYVERLRKCIDRSILMQVESLCEELFEAWKHGRNVFICGNGGSAGNAIHIANDLHYGIGVSNSKSIKTGIRVEALPSNSAIITCLANDIGYEYIYSNQIETKAAQGDTLIVLSGSGNSENIVNAIMTAKNMGVNTTAILGFDGGSCKNIADRIIHFEINDMQISEDTQLIVEHICMQWLNKRMNEERKPRGQKSKFV